MDLFRKRFGNAHTLKYLSGHFNLNTTQLKIIQKIYMDNIEIKELDKDKISKVLSAILAILKENSEYNYLTIKSYSSSASRVEDSMKIVTYIGFKNLTDVTFIYDPDDQRLKIMSIDAFKQARRNNLSCL